MKTCKYVSLQKATTFFFTGPAAALVAPVVVVAALAFEAASVEAFSSCSICSLRRRRTWKSSSSAAPPPLLRAEEAAREVELAEVVGGRRVVLRAWSVKRAGGGGEVGDLRSKHSLYSKPQQRLTILPQRTVLSQVVLPSTDLARPTVRIEALRGILWAF